MRSFWKFSFFALISTLLFYSCTAEEGFEGIFSYTPVNAEPGDEIIIKYNSDSSEFAGRSNFNAIAYLYDVELYKTIDVPLTESGSIFSGKINTDSNTRGILLKFISGNDIDNNENKGYKIFLTDDSGHRIAGSLAGYAEAINHWGAYYLDIDRDKEKALRYMEEDINANPEIKPLFLKYYLDLVSAVKSLKKEEIVRKELSELEESNPAKEDLLLVLYEWYSDIGDSEKADHYKNVLMENFPDGKLTENQMVKEFKGEKDPVKKLEIAMDFEKKFPSSKYCEYMFDVTANVYRDNKQYDEALEFLKKYVDKTSTYRFYSVAKRILDENADLNTALDIAELGVSRSLRELKNPSHEKPLHLSEMEWKKDREYYLGLNYFVKGKVLYELDRREDALAALKEAVRFTREEDDLINELYAKMLIENGRYEFAMATISGFIKSGHGTAQMKTYLKEAYLNEKGTENGFETYAAQFESAARELLINRLRGEMFIEPAPEFSLNDLNGAEVSLGDFKGKTVILDFWATWCGPCLQSFPAMQKAVDKFKDDDNVKFLFLNSWERVENKFENATEFIAKNEYPFHVLLDLENNVIEKYKVSGIPTKFIIDGEGNIRFKSVGFEGADEKLVEEISTMISMVN